MPERASRRFPWLPLALLLVGIVVFWVVPAMQPKPRVTVQASGDGK
ncbi:MAG: hypothetical protein JNM28_08845 [Armatimonadetes bacterium]|nr:hypothetical protein [Armatimonadota bacterium]MBS1710831.1 hypothetical protein [Armatimonadota bacterium]MBX3108503.1 hypothetical protein [Fimbriimonadaceae bacterium]